MEGIGCADSEWIKNDRHTFLMGFPSSFTSQTLQWNGTVGGVCWTSVELHKFSNIGLICKHAIWIWLDIHFNDICGFILVFGVLFLHWPGATYAGVCSREAVMWCICRVQKWLVHVLMCFDVISSMEGKWGEVNWLQLTSLHTLWVTCVFLTCPNLHWLHWYLPKSIDINIGGLHPSLEGRGQVAASLGVEGPKID